MSSPISPDIRYSPPRWYFSPLEKAFESAPDKVFGQAAQVKLWLAGNKSKLGLKDDEIFWTGINDWLDMQGKQKVSKADVLGYLAGSGVQVQEVMKGVPGYDENDPQLPPLDLAWTSSMRQMAPRLRGDRQEWSCHWPR